MSATLDRVIAPHLVAGKCQNQRAGRREHSRPLFWAKSTSGYTRLVCPECAAIFAELHKLPMPLAEEVRA